MKRKTVKKIAGCVLAVTMTVSAVPVGMLQGVGEGICALAEETNVEDGFQYSVGDDGTVQITQYTGTNTKIVVPDTIEGKKVTSIGDLAFRGCSRLSEITIPDSVTSIGYGAFLDCSSLNAITIPESVTSIGDLAFGRCLNLKKIELASGNNKYYQTIEGVLYNKEGTELIAYPNGKGTSYTIPEGVTSIGDCAFEGCSSLNAITIPESVTSIGYYAFYGCSSLSEISIPEGVTRIRSYAFSKCPNLVICGVTGSYAESYAKDNDIPFKTKILSETGFQILYTPDTIPEDVTLQATLLTAGNVNYDKINISNLPVDSTIDTSAVKFQPYEITLLDENNMAVQPTDSVTVKIPCPDGYDGSKCKVYYVAGDGTMTDMNAVYGNGYLSFETKHFSTYMVAEISTESVSETPTETPIETPTERPAETPTNPSPEVKILPGDVNGDNDVTLTDSALVRRYIAGWDVTIDLNAADVNGDGSVTLTDSALIRRYIARWNVTLGE